MVARRGSIVESLDRQPSQAHDSNSAVNRATRLLLALGQGRPSHGSSLTELSAETSLHKATALRILASLEQSGLVDRVPDGRFRIGMRLVELVSAYVEDLDLVEQARPVLEDLCRETGETVHLGVPSGIEVVYIDKVESAQSLRMVSRIGTRNPSYRTALGKAILAQASESDLSKVLAAGLEQRTVNTLVDANVLRADLASIRTQGYAVDREENKLGIRCVAADVRDRRGRVVGAISVSGPSVRMEDRVCAEIGVAVRRAADEVSGRLGYRPVQSTA